MTTIRPRPWSRDRPRAAPCSPCRRARKRTPAASPGPACSRRTTHYLALTLDGTDVLLMAADHTLRRELSRRIRDDLIRLGIVQAGPAVRIADGATASTGDLIICTRNDHTIEAGEPGRTLANGDLLRIDAVTPAGLIVRRALDADPPPGSGGGPASSSSTPVSRRRAGLRGHRPRCPKPHRDTPAWP